MNFLSFPWVLLLPLLVYLLIAMIQKSASQTDLVDVDEQIDLDEAEPVQIDLNEFDISSNEVDEDRSLPQVNPRLASLLNRSLDEDWLNQPAQLERLKELVNNQEFCRDWWQINRDNKQELATTIEQLTGLSINPNSLFDVQLAIIQQNQRQLLNLLHIITLFVRLKVNANEDTVQRFTHRSVPRTFFFAGEHQSDELVKRLIQGVATVINSDREMHDRLQVIYLDQKLPLLYASADLSEQLSRDSAENSDVISFALNSSAVIGTRTKTNFELQERTKANNVFLFGMTDQAAKQITEAYDPYQIYAANSELQQAIDLIASGYFSEKDDRTFKPLIDQLLTEDPDLVLSDYLTYVACQEEISQIYQDQKAWTRRSILTAAEVAMFWLEQRTRVTV